MESPYDIAQLKKTLEELTNKEVHLYDKELGGDYSTDLDQTKLDQLVKEAFDLTLQQLAVKNLFKANLKQFIKKDIQIPDGKKLDDLMRKYKGNIEEVFLSIRQWIKDGKPTK